MVTAAPALPPAATQPPPAMMMVHLPPQPPAVPLPPPTDGPSLRARYGEPDFIRRERETELWRYDGAACSIFFFLYRESDVLKLRYSETNPRGMNMAADPRCIESLSARAGMF
jgi:hypothetical protein